MGCGRPRSQCPRGLCSSAVPPAPPHPESSLIGLQGPHNLSHSWAPDGRGPTGRPLTSPQPHARVLPHTCGPVASKCWAFTHPAPNTHDPAHVRLPHPLKRRGLDRTHLAGSGVRLGVGQPQARVQAREGLNSGRKGLAASEQTGRSVGCRLTLRVSPSHLGPWEPRVMGPGCLPPPLHI